MKNSQLRSSNAFRRRVCGRFVRDATPSVSAGERSAGRHKARSQTPAWNIKGFLPFRVVSKGNPGQSLVLIALILPPLLALVLTCIEIGQRYADLAAIQDALDAATRSSVQSFSYAAFAQNKTSLAPAQSIGELARYNLFTNLAQVRGLSESAIITAARLQLTVLPSGGTCATTPPVTLTSPTVCATLQPHMTGLLGWGEWQPRLYAIATIDQIVP